MGFVRAPGKAPPDDRRRQLKWAVHPWELHSQQHPLTEGERQARGDESPVRLFQISEEGPRIAWMEE